VKFPLAYSASTTAGRAALKGSAEMPPSCCRQCEDSAVERMPIEKNEKKTFRKQIIQKKLYLCKNFETD